MANITQINVTEPLLGDWVKDTKECLFDLKVDEANTLRLIFPDQMIGDLMYALQRLQSLALEQRKKIGLPTLATAYVKDIKELEYGRDDINQIAVIQSHYTDGTSQSTHFEKKWLIHAIRYLTDALRAFENQSKSPKH